MFIHFRNIKVLRAVFALMLCGGLLFGCGEVVEDEVVTTDGYVWYEDEYVEFQYPEGAEVNVVDIITFSDGFYDPINIDEAGNDWMSISITDDEYSIDLHRYVGTLGVREVFKYYSSGEVVFYDVDGNVEYNLSDEELFIEKIGPDYLNLYLLYYPNANSSLHLVHAYEDTFYGSSYDYDLVSDTSFTIFTDEDSVILNDRVVSVSCSVNDQFEFDLCVEFVDKFFNSFSDLKNWELFPLFNFY